MTRGTCFNSVGSLTIASSGPTHGLDEMKYVLYLSIYIYMRSHEQGTFRSDLQHALARQSQIENTDSQHPEHLCSN